VNNHEPDEILVQAFAKLDKLGLGVAVGVVVGLAVFCATIILILKGGPQPVGPTLSLLGQYYMGYTVTVPGAFVGLLYGFLTGFVLGFLFAGLRNAFLTLYAASVRAKQELRSLDDFLDHM
jgi:hypothetical protein